MPVSVFFFFFFFLMIRPPPNSPLFPTPPLSRPREEPAPQKDGPAKTDSTAKSPPAPVGGPNEEVSSRDTPTTFKVRVNLVLVRVVVRDQQGKIVSKLKKEDFQLYDNRKLQTISSFSVETPETRTASAVASSAAERSEEHTSELQSRLHLVCRLLLEKKNTKLAKMN